jgi:putative transposase
MEHGVKLQPIENFRIYRRNLPHWEQPGSTYFITFRTFKGSILTDEAKQITFNSIKFHAGWKYKLYSCFIMETHAHCILQPLIQSESRYYSLAQIMHSIKSYSSHRIKKYSNINNKIWQPENYDRIIRDENDYLEKMEYIIYNPVKAELVDKPENYRWLFYEGSE